jgi:hypothetical protein
MIEEHQILSLTPSKILIPPMSSVNTHHVPLVEPLVNYCDQQKLLSAASKDPQSNPLFKKFKFLPT